MRKKSPLAGIVATKQYSQFCSMLTEREKEVLMLIVREYSCKRIAEELKISLHTVESHRKNLYKKTKAKTVIGLVKYAYKHLVV